jgi:hypothetical protein
VHDLLQIGDAVSVTVVGGGLGGNDIRIHSEAPWCDETESGHQFTIATAANLAAGAEHTFTFFVGPAHLANNSEYFRVNMALPEDASGSFLVTNVEIRRSQLCCDDFPDCTCTLTTGSKIWELNIVPALANALNAGSSFEGVMRSGTPTFAVAGNAFTVSGRTESWHSIDIPLAGIGVTETGKYRLIVEGSGTTNQLQALFPADGAAGSGWNWGAVTGSSGLLVMEFDRTVPAGIVLDSGGHRIRIATSGTDNFTITRAVVERLSGDVAFVPITSIAFEVTVSGSTGGSGIPLSFRQDGTWTFTTHTIPATNGTHIIPAANFNPGSAGFVDLWSLGGVAGSTATVAFDKVIVNGIDMVFVTPIAIPVGDSEIWHIDGDSGLPSISWHNRWAGMSDGQVIARSTDGKMHLAFDENLAGLNSGTGLIVLRTGAGASIGAVRPDGNGVFTSLDVIWVARFIAGHGGVTLTDRRLANIRREDRDPLPHDITDLLSLLVGRSLEELLARSA